MTPRSFWTILIKLTGIYIAVQSFTTIWTSINIVIIYSSLGSIMNKSNFYSNQVYFVFAASIILFLIYILAFYCFVFKANWVVDSLKLDKGFQDERFEFNLHQSTILKIAIIIIGGLLLGSILPDLINELVNSFQKANKYQQPEHSRNTAYIISNSIKIIIGVFMLTRSTSIVNFIERRSKKPTQDDIQKAEP